MPKQGCLTGLSRGGAALVASFEAPRFVSKLLKTGFYAQIPVLVRMSTQYTVHGGSSHRTLNQRIPELVWIYVSAALCEVIEAPIKRLG